MFISRYSTKWTTTSRRCWNGKAEEEIGAKRRNRTMKKKPEFFFHRRFLLSSPFLAWLHFRTFFFLLPRLFFAHVTRERKKKNGEITRRIKKSFLMGKFSFKFTYIERFTRERFHRAQHTPLVACDPDLFYTIPSRSSNEKIIKRHGTTKILSFNLNKKNFFFFTAPASPYIHSTFNENHMNQIRRPGTIFFLVNKKKRRKSDE